MPLVRCEIRNEYALGATELYREADKDDPKALLDGLTVAGLVGILRQLGDLAEFAAEVFHDLQEQVMATAAKSSKLMVRVEHVEAVLPSIEKAVLSQTSHIHFAYTSGSYWHAKIRTKQNHLTHSDLPRFIMDSYEECRDPPCLQLLDKFDTGGPGACLKRYSDPSFFKRALATSVSEVDEVHQEKKAHKIKRKRGRRRNVVVRAAMAPSQHSGRMSSASPSICQQDLYVDTTSTSDVRSRSELEEASFNSGRSDYIDCIFGKSISMPHNEHEQNGLPSSRLKKQSHDTLFFIPPSEETGGGDGDGVLPHMSLQEENMVNSSYVTWVEKTEIVKPTSPESKNFVEVQSNGSELMSSNYDRYKLENEANNHVNIDPGGAIHVDENSMLSLSDGNQLDEVGSETDNYMDALNTTVSEAETDVERETKREVKIPFMDLGNEGAECKLSTENKTTQTSTSFDFEPCIISQSPSHRPLSQKLSELVSPEDLIDAEPPTTISKSHNPNLIAGTDSCGSTDIFDVSKSNACGTSTVDLPSSGFGIPNSHVSPSEKIVGSFSESKESPTEISGKPSINIWTNGGLLGLAPSKPPDCTVLKDEYNLSNETVKPGSHSIEPQQKLSVSAKASELTEKDRRLKGAEARSQDTINSKGGSRDQLVRNIADIVCTTDNSDCSTSGHNMQDSCMSKNDSLELSSNVSKAKHENYKDSSSSNNNTNGQGRGLAETGFLEAELPLFQNAERSSSKTSQEIREPSSYLLLPTPRLLVNGGGRKVSHAHGKSSVPSGRLVENSHYIPHTSKKEVLSLEPNSKDHHKHRSPTNSLTSSPPLEHMKISFHPADGYDSSKLKLMFCDGNYMHDSIEDVSFPSFQLLPEPVIQSDDDLSESDDDTFSGSSRYKSDELLSQVSETNSEHWTSSRTPGSADNEIYDALRRVSSNESISSSFEVEGMVHHGVYPGHDFKSPNTIIDSEPIRSDSLMSIPDGEYLGSVQCADEPTPSPPPFPPGQWCLTKPPFGLVEDKQGAMSATLDPLNDHEVPTSNTSQQPEAPPPKQLHNKETTVCSTERKEQKQSELKETEEDLLHQIRSKSMNLRRTMPTKPAINASPAADLKVTAILEKANAIRQAFVGSDEDDESDNWSDG